jgi:hypothetical protein
VKPLLPSPQVPGNTEWERFDNAFRKFIAVPKEMFAKEEGARLRQVREKKRAAKKTA